MTEPRRRPAIIARAAAWAQKIPVALAHIEKRHAGIDAGVVDEHVEPPELAGDLRDHRLGARRPRHVGLDERGAPAGSADLLEKLFGRGAIVEVVHTDIGAFPGKRQSDRAPDSLLGAGHQGHLSTEPHRRLLRPATDTTSARARPAGGHPATACRARPPRTRTLSTRGEIC